MQNSSRPAAPTPTPRWTGAEEAPVLAALHAQAFGDGSWGVGDLIGLMEAPCAVTAVIDDGAPAAFALAWVVADEAELLTLAVAPGARRRGLGRALLEAVMARARSLGAEALYLEVAVDNAPALALYAGAGFEEAGRRPAYYPRQAQGSADALVLRRALNTLGG